MLPAEGAERVTAPGQAGVDQISAAAGAVEGTAGVGDSRPLARAKETPAGRLAVANGKPVASGMSIAARAAVPGME